MKNLYIIIVVSLIFFSCSVKPLSGTREALNTLCTISLYDNKKVEILNTAFDKIQNVHNLMARNIEKSDVWNINHSAGVKPVSVSKITFDLIQESIYFSNISAGLYDISICPLLVLWGFGEDNKEQKVPALKDITKKKNLIDYKKINLNPANLEVFLGNRGMMIDLGSIGKGLATDEAANYLRSMNVKSAMLNLGGNVFAIGKKPDGTEWRIGVQDPENSSNILGVIAVTDRAVVTSGIYERNFVQDNKLYHHIVNPFTGFPEDNGLLSVTIIGENATKCDGLSTTIFLLGLDKGLKQIENESGYYALFITEEKEIIFSKGFPYKFTKMNEYYSIKN